MSDDFNWGNDNSVIYPTRHGVAVYRNGIGDVVIRQEQSELIDDDLTIVVPENCAKAVADAILRELSTDA